MTNTDFMFQSPAKLQATMQTCDRNLRIFSNGLVAEVRDMTQDDKDHWDDKPKPKVVRGHDRRKGDRREK